MGAWNAGQALNLEIVPRDEGCVLGIEGDVVAVDCFIG